MNPCTTTAPTTQYVVRTSASPQKSSWKWRHCRQNVAVLEIVPGTAPRMTSVRARGVRRIVSLERGLYVGRTHRDQFSKALLRAEALVAELTRAAQRVCDAASAPAHSCT